MSEAIESEAGSTSAVTKNLATFSTGPGALVKHASGIFRVVEVLGLESVFARNVDTGRPDVLRLFELEPLGNEIPPMSMEDIAAVNDEDWQVARARFEIIRPLIEAGHLTRSVVSEHAARVGKDTSTLYRWLSKYRNFDAVSSLLEGKRGWKKGNWRLDAHAERALRAVIDEYYMTAEAPSLTKTHRLLAIKCREYKVEAPSPTALKARIDAIPLEERMKKRGKKEAAKQRFQATPGTTPDVDFPLSRVEIDHTRVDVILVDDVYRKPIGRPWITLAMDGFSRMVLGFYLSFDAPSRTSSAMCMAHAILPKEEGLLKLGIDAVWPAWGRPKLIVSDNGPEFRSSDFIRACTELGIDLHWRPACTPRFGGRIERLQGTLMREIHDIPGTTFSNVEQRGEYDSEGRAIMNLSEFERQLVKVICNEYHRRPHSAIGMTPLRKWEQGLLGGPTARGTGLPSRTQDKHALMLHFMPSFERTIQKDGVTLDNLRYFDHCLRPWIGQEDTETKASPKLRFRRDPRDLSALWFFDPDVKQYFRVPWVYTEDSISIWEHRRAQKELKDQGFDPGDVDAVFESIKSRREDIAESAAKTKRARREQQRNSEHRKVAKSAGSPAPSASPPAGKGFVSSSPPTARQSGEVGFSGMTDAPIAPTLDIG